MATERERVNKLESRAREAENALQKIRNDVSLLKKKGMDATYSAEADSLEAENVKLTKEVTSLKQQLAVEEIRDGVVQYSLPTDSASGKASTPPQAAAAVSHQDTPIPKQQMKKKTSGKGGGRGDGERRVDFSRLDMRIGKIVKAWKHPDADTLYVEEVDVGEDRLRTVCSGLVASMSLEEVQGRMAVFLCNLKPVKMRGVISEAMIMCASTPEKVEILEPPDDCVVGERVVCMGYPGEPDAELDAKKKIFDAIRQDLHTNDEGVACYKDTPFVIVGKGVCCSDTLFGTQIK